VRARNLASAFQYKSMITNITQAFRYHIGDLITILSLEEGQNEKPANSGS
jgi:hypothetical protein